LIRERKKFGQFWARRSKSAWVRYGTALKAHSDTETAAFNEISDLLETIRQTDAVFESAAREIAADVGAAVGQRPAELEPIAFANPGALTGANRPEEAKEETGEAADKRGEPKEAAGEEGGQAGEPKEETGEVIGQREEPQIEAVEPRKEPEEEGARGELEATLANPFDD
jgi:hypothetical protein